MSEVLSVFAIWWEPILVSTSVTKVYERTLDAPIYLDDVWMPPVHTSIHKERILCQTKEVIHMPQTSACPL